MDPLSGLILEIGVTRQIVSELKLDKKVQVYSDGSSRIADPVSYFKGSDRLRSHLNLMDKVKNQARVRYVRVQSPTGSK